MRRVVCDLDLAASIRLVDRRFHRRGHAVRIHDHAPFDVAGRPSDHLNKRTLRTQVALLVRVEDRHERDLRKVDTFAKQVHSDHDVVDPEPQVAKDLDALERLDLGVQVLHFDAHLAEVIGEILGHLLCEGRDDRALAALDACVELGKEVVDLPLGLAHLDLWVDETGRPDDLLDHVGGMLKLVRAGGRRDVDRLIEALLELGERERPVVQCARKPEPVVDEDLLARTVTEVHAAHLRDRDVGLVDEREEVRREVVQERPGPAPRWTPR